MEIQVDVVDCVTPPYMSLPKIKFMISLGNLQNNKSLRETLLNGIIAGNMAPYYKKVCADLHWIMDDELLNRMQLVNAEELSKLEKIEHKAVIDDNLGPKVWQPRIQYLFSIGDVETATNWTNSKIEDLKENFSTRQRFDCILILYRLAFFNDVDVKGMKSAIKKAKELLEKSGGGDWASLNKLKVYESIYLLSVRKFDEATALLTDCVPTFESYELIDFGSVVKYTVLASMISLPRKEVRERLQYRGTIVQALCSEFPGLKEYVDSLYECRYGDFMKSLEDVYTKMVYDPVLSSHARYYLREMRLKAFAQQLTAYRSLRIDAMASIFSLEKNFLEEEIARYITAGRLPVKIDKVSGCIVRPICDQIGAEKTASYQETIKKGDFLLNRIKKLARIVDF